MGCRSWAALLLVVVACGSPQTVGQPTPSPRATAAAVTPASAAPSAAVAPPTLSTASSRYGQIVVDGSGRALYLFDAEPDPQPRCYGACASAWPPLLTTGQPVAGPSLVAALIGTAMRSDGSMQVTYNAHPLYYYVGDHGPGETLCQAVTEYGGGWYVLRPDGTKISQA